MIEQCLFSRYRRPSCGGLQRKRTAPRRIRLRRGARISNCRDPDIFLQTSIPASTGQTAIFVTDETCVRVLAPEIRFREAGIKVVRLAVASFLHQRGFAVFIAVIDAVNDHRGRFDAIVAGFTIFP